MSIPNETGSSIAARSRLDQRAASILVEHENPLALGDFCPTCGTRLDDPAPNGCGESHPCPMSCEVSRA